MIPVQDIMLSFFHIWKPAIKSAIQAKQLPLLRQKTVQGCCAGTRNNQYQQRSQIRHDQLTVFAS
jgi:hypothetical protein